MTKLKLVATALLAVAFAISTGCSPQQSHPNQINTFDGASYDSLTLAHAALSSLRPTIATTFPQYKPVFNQAVGAYQAAFEAYSGFRSLPANQGAAASAINTLTIAIVGLESTLQADMHVPPATVQRVRERAAGLRAAAAPKLTISDVLQELEIAATIAASIPGTQPYSTIAQIVIAATQSAVKTFSAIAGQPIDLTTLTPLAPIS